MTLGPIVPMSPPDGAAAPGSLLDQLAVARGMPHFRAIVDAARRLIEEKGEFTTHELVNEAGVALQTFYRHFGGKDQLLLAVIEDTVAEQAAWAEETARSLPDPVSRLRFYVTTFLRSLGNSDGAVGARYITSQSLRLHQVHPKEISKLGRSYVEVLVREVLAAKDAGLLSPTDPLRDAWLVANTVRFVYHHYAFVPLDRPAEEIAEHTWTFLLRALGGDPDAPPAARTRSKRKSPSASRPATDNSVLAPPAGSSA